MDWRERARGFAGRNNDAAATEAREYIDARVGTRASDEAVAQRRTRSQAKMTASAPKRGAAKKQ